MYKLFILYKGGFMTIENKIMQHIQELYTNTPTKNNRDIYHGYLQALEDVAKFLIQGIEYEMSSKEEHLKLFNVSMFMQRKFNMDKDEAEKTAKQALFLGWARLPDYWHSLPGKNHFCFAWIVGEKEPYIYTVKDETCFFNYIDEDDIKEIKAFFHHENDIITCKNGVL